MTLHAAVLLASGGYRAPELSHPLSAFQRVQPKVNLANGTVNVLAIMVQFQKDDDSLSSGNGQFMMTNGTGLDAPPHNRSYFENHLLFLKNYFYKVSDGKLNINYDVLDSVITLPHQMKYYSPPEGGPSNAENLALLYEDSWHAADSIYKNFDFSQYQCFVIFHAGSGRDIDFTSTFGYDPWPYNIPSIYLGMASLRAMLGSGYNGQPVDNGSFHIPNSIIMPESELFETYDASGQVQDSLLLGTNGMMAANFGSFLGLPDLFDTKTGVTGIGGFGLMDGQSIFSYGGIFPPEPSAWSKAYLGWVKPVAVSPAAATTFQLYANETGKYSVLKVPINGSEYFLLENRERDALNDGELITSFYNGKYDTTRMTLATDTTYYDGIEVKGINGVVTDADEFDWSLPSPGTPADNQKYPGGILIWHIDQSVIDQNLASNTVNADPAHRGVAVMEAHGANMIGFLIQTITGSYYYSGSPYDFWFKDNPAPSYGNQFTPTSLPNSDSYSDANSHVYITDFSNPAGMMTLDVRVGDSNVQPTAGFPKNIYGATVNSSPVFGHIGPDGKLQVIANNGDSLYAFNMDGSSAGFDSTGLFSNIGGRFQPLVSSKNPASNVIYAADDTTFFGLVDKDDNHPGTADVSFSYQLGLSLYRTGQPLLEIGTKIIAFGAVPGLWSIYSPSGYPAAFSTVYPDHPAFSSVSADSVTIYAAPDTSSVYLNMGQYGVYHINMDSVAQNHGLPSMSIFGNSGAIIGMTYGYLSVAGQPDLVELTARAVYIDSASGQVAKIFTAFPGDTITTGPVLADLNGNGDREIIFATQTKVYAISYTGAVLNNFPISTVGSEALPSDANRITGSIAVADLDGDGNPEIVFGTKGGTIYAFTGATGKILPGFPLSVGDGLAGSPAVTYDAQTGNLYLAAIGLDGYLYSWTFKGSSASQVAWGNLLGDNYHTNSMTEPLAAQPVVPTASLMPTAQVYNWPNPVTNGMTKIHFYLRDNAQVSVGIFSFAGDKVADFHVQGTGGMANEVSWNTSGVQSGVYFARVEAVSSKERDVAIIKIAVVK